MKKTAIILIAASALVQTAFAATSIPIPNASFELAYPQDNSLLGIGNWSQTAGPTGLTGAVGGLTPTVGSWMLFINGAAAAGPGVVYQKFGSLLAGSYLFQTDVGFRTDVGAPTTAQYDIMVFGVSSTGPDSTLLARNTLTVPAAGTWTTDNLSFSVAGNEPWFGTLDQLQLVLTIAGDSAVQVEYDNIRGSFTAIPETSSCILGLSGIALLLGRRRITR